MASRDKLAEFVAWCAKHVTGDEKGEAQIFLDHLFQSFGHAGGLKEAGATLEWRVSKADGGTAFADYVWKPVVLEEMKKRGESLQKHYRQAFGYRTRLVPNRPRHVLHCNFEKFRALTSTMTSTRSGRRGSIAPDFVAVICLRAICVNERSLFHCRSVAEKENS
jgi:hypothetical protein